MILRPNFLPQPENLFRTQLFPKLPTVSKPTLTESILPYNPRLNLTFNPNSSQRCGRPGVRCHVPLRSHYCSSTTSGSRGSGMLRTRALLRVQSLTRSYATASSPHALVFLEHNQGVIDSGSLSALTAATQLGGRVTGLIVGDSEQVSSVLDKAKKHVKFSGYLRQAHPTLYSPGLTASTHSSIPLPQNTSIQSRR